MVGELSMLFGVGLVAVAAGVLMITFARPIVRFVAKKQAEQFRNQPDWVPRLFHRTPFGWFQTKVSGRTSRELVEVIAVNPDEWPFLMWFVRFQGAFAVLICFTFLGAGMARLLR